MEFDLHAFRDLASAGAPSRVNLPLSWMIELGLLPNMLKVFKFGYNPQISPLGGAPGDIWPGESVGGVRNYPFYPSVAETLDVVSTDAVDADGNTGAHEVLIQGLGDDFCHAEETIPLGGLTTVTTTVAFRRVFRTRIIKGAQIFGDNYRPNQGDILVTGNTTGLDASIILSRFGQSTQCNYTVPAGFKGIVVSATSQTLGTDRASTGLVRAPLGEPGQTNWFHTSSNSATHIDSDVVALGVDEKTDIKMVTFPSQPNVEIAGWYTVIMVPLAAA